MIRTKTIADDQKYFKWEFTIFTIFMIFTIFTMFPGAGSETGKQGGHSSQDDLLSLFD